MSEIEEKKLDVLENHYNNLYRYTHLLDSSYKKNNMYEGMCIMIHLKMIKHSIIYYNHDIDSFLDYGCGKAEQYLKFKIHEYFLPKKQVNPCLYDPGYEPYSLLPSGKFDLTLSFDVFEHIHVKLLNRNLKRIFERTNKMVILGICVKKATMILPNKENAHCTVEHPDWWINKIKPFAEKYKILTVISFYGDEKLNQLKTIKKNGEVTDLIFGD